MRKYPSEEEISKNSTQKLKIEHFLETKNISKMLRSQIGRRKLAVEIEETILPRTDKDHLPSISNEASLYFRQSLVLYRNLTQMDDVASPLVEYYSLLQCVKGALILEYNFNKSIFFSYHGLTPIYSEEKQKNQKYYRKAGVMPGVFLALVLMSSRFYTDVYAEKIWTMDEFLQKNYQPSLIEILNVVKYIDEDKLIQINFIGSWMLSTLVRYQPLIWKQIIDGNKDDILINIQNFRRNRLPETSYNIILPYIDTTGIFPDIELI